MRRLVVAIDYGTSNSGAAYAIVHDDEEKDQSHDISDDIEVVRDWPRAGAARDGSEKVHSDIAYNAEGQAIGYGFEASKHGVTPLQLSGSNYGILFVQGGMRRVTWLVNKGQVVKKDMCTEPYNLGIDDQPWLDEDKHCLVYVPIVASSDDKPGELYSESVAPHAEIKCRVLTALRFASGSKEIRTDSPRRAWHVPATLLLYFDGAIRYQIEDKEVAVAAVKYFQDLAGCRTMGTDGEHGTAADSEPKLKDLFRARADSKLSSLNGPSSKGRATSSSPIGGSRQQKVNPRAVAAAALAWEKEIGGSSARPPHQPHPSMSSASSASSSSTHRPHFDDRLTEQDAKKKDKKHHHHFFSLDLRTKRDLPPPQTLPGQSSAAANGYVEGWEWVGENKNRPDPESSDRTASCRRVRGR